MPTHRTVTPNDPARTAINLEAVRSRPLEDALARGISDPGSFLPRRISPDLDEDRVYEHISRWAARACALIVADRYDNADTATEAPEFVADPTRVPAAITPPTRRDSQCLTDALVDTHIARTGLRDLQRKDPAAAIQVNILRDTLRLVEIALTDEAVPAGVADRILRAAVYGAVPTSTDVQSRLDERARMVDFINSRATPGPMYSAELTDGLLDALTTKLDALTTEQAPE